MEYYSFIPFQTAPISREQYEKEQAILNRKRNTLPDGPLAIRAFTLDKIHAVNPSKGWSMRSIQDQAAIEFPLRDKEYVYSMVRSVVLQHCNL
tara:strand:- start:552 stop:830 length:279 start_codon:yes stop_codon:yes gene_type:complete